MPSHFRLDLSVTAGNAHEFDLWRSGMSPLFDMDAPDAEARSRFEVRMTSYQFADAAIMRGHSSGASFERTHLRAARSGLDNICLLLYTRGGCALDVEGRAYAVEVGDICFLDLSRPCSLKAPDYESLTLILPRAAIEPHVACLDDLHGRILPKSSPLNAILTGHLGTLFAQAPGLDAADGRAAAAGTAALIAAIAGPSETGRESMDRFGNAASLHGYRRFIEDNLHIPELGPETLCNRFGISRATLYRIFAPIGGVSQYIHRRRLARAYRMLLGRDTPHRRIGDISGRCGFSSNSVFSRAIRQAFGMAPAELRRNFAAAAPPDLTLTNEGGFGTMGRWLLGLDLDKQ